MVDMRAAHELELLSKHVTRVWFPNYPAAQQFLFLALPEENPTIQ